MKRLPWDKSYRAVAGIKNLSRPQLRVKAVKEIRRRLSVSPETTLDRWYCDARVEGKLCTEGLEKGQHWDGDDPENPVWLSVGAIRMLVLRDTGLVVHLPSIGAWAKGKNVPTKQVPYKVTTRRIGVALQKSTKMYMIGPIRNEPIDPWTVL